MIDCLFKSVLIFLVLIISGCQADDSPPEIIRPVKVMTAPDSSRTLTRVFPGKISPAREVNLSFRVSNRMTHFPVKEGQYVESGDVIASMDPRDFETAVRNIRGNLDEARANLKAMQAGARLEDIRSLESRLVAARAAMDEANLQYERYRKLHETGAVATSVLDNARSRQEEARSNVRSLEMELEKALAGARDEDIEAMQARIRSLEAGLDEAGSALEDSVLRAPFDGFVAEKYVDSHENISAGQPVVRLQDMSRLEISAGLPEQLMVRKDTIKSIHILLETFPQHFFPARIKEITTDASAMTMTYRLTAVMDRPLDIPVYPSMAADMYIAFSTEPGSTNVVVPETALVSRDGSSRLWFFDPDTGTVSSREVETGEMTRGGVQIVQGIRPGEILVSAGADFLEEGQKVRVVRDQ
jgi:multidrug efflux pump subunit AcrA (membrane-fusion protein)